MSGLFGNMLFVGVLQIACIVLCFFLPEFLFRMCGKDRTWHVPMSSLLLIVSVVALTWLHGAGADVRVRAHEVPEVEVVAKAPVETPAPPLVALEPVRKHEITTRMGTMPLPLQKPATLALDIQNMGPESTYTCSFEALDANAASPLPEGALQVEALSVKPVVAANATGHCSWRVTPLAPGAYVLRVTASASDAVDEKQAQEFLVEAHQVARVDSEAPVRVYYSRIEGNDEALAEKLRSAGFHNVKAMGLWETRSEEQYVFYRDSNKSFLDELFVEIGIPAVQPYYYDGDNVGGKVKDIFVAQNDLEFLVIVH